MGAERTVPHAFPPMLVLPIGALDAPLQCFIAEDLNLGLMSDAAGDWHALISLRRGAMGVFMPLSAPALRDLAAVYVQKAHDLEQIAAGQHPLSPAQGGRQ